ncbi:hypothetical protein GCM10010837_47100 [Aminobacter niigataensis]
MQVSDAPSIAGPGHNLATTADVFRDRFKDLIDEVEALAIKANGARGALTADTIASDNDRNTFVEIGVNAAKLAKSIDEKRAKVIEPLRTEVDEWNSLFGTDKPAEGSLKYRCNAMKKFAEMVVGRYDDEKREEERRKAAAEADAARALANRKLDEAATSGHSVLSDIALQEATSAEQKAAVLENAALTAGNGPTRTEAGTISQVKNWTYAVKDYSKIDLNKLRGYGPFSVDGIEKALAAYAKKNKNTAPLAGVDFIPDQKTRFRA